MNAGCKGNTTTQCWLTQRLGHVAKNITLALQRTATTGAMGLQRDIPLFYHSAASGQWETWERQAFHEHEPHATVHLL